MAFEGMDIEIVESLGAQLRNQEQALVSIISAIDGLINQLEGVWRGIDATQFQACWQGQHKPALLVAAQSVGGLGQSAFLNANQQQAASAN